MGSATEGPLVVAVIRLAQGARLQIQKERLPDRFPVQHLAELIRATRNEPPNNSTLPVCDARRLEEIKRPTVGN